MSNEMPAESNYSDCFTALWALMTYSAGIPILYPISLLTFSLIYIVNKILIIKYYAKSTIFDYNMQ